MTPGDIQQIIDKYGRPVYEAALRQVYVQIATDIIWLIALLVLIVIALRKWMPWLRRRYREEQERSYGDTMECVMGMAGVGLVVAIAIILAIVDVNEIIRDVINPTWAALSIILAAATGKYDLKFVARGA